MGRRLIFATLSLGVMMACTLVTAQAADYRKEKAEKYLVTDQVDYAAVVDVDFTVHYLTAYKQDLPVVFIAPENCIYFLNQVRYIDPGNDNKPDNRYINGLLNGLSKQERISIGLNL